MKDLDLFFRSAYRITPKIDYNLLDLSLKNLFSSYNSDSKLHDVNIESLISHFKGGLKQITLMRTQAGLGKPLFLVSGNGFAFGRWCIVKITENQSNFLNDGAPRKIEFSISLKRYGEDQKRGIKGIIQNVVSSL